MPVVGEFHSKYWKRQNADHRPPVLAPSKGGYPLWQAHIVMGSFLGALVGRLVDVGAYVVAVVRWWWRLGVRVSNLDVEQRVILLTVLDAMESPAFVHARRSVRETSQILGFRDPAMWKGLSHHMKADQDHAENVYRHMEAVKRTRAKHDALITNPDANLAVELAYHGYSVLRK